MTKLVFMGTPAFSVPILEGLNYADTGKRSGSEARYPCAAARENLRFARNGRNH